MIKWTEKTVTGAPAAGQYNVINGVYMFAAADAGASVLISYSYVPADVEHACISMVSERYSYKSRIGTVSKGIGGQETVSFLNSLLEPYRRVVLV